MTEESAAEQLTFWEHVASLRSTFIKMGIAILIGFILAFALHAPLIELLLRPIASFANPIVLGPLEGVRVTLSLSFWAGVILSSPFWLFFLMQFLLPALYTYEKKLLSLFLILTFFLMLGGIYVAYLFSLPLVAHYLVSFNSALGANFWTLSHSVNFVLWLILVHVLCFELFLVLLTLVHFHILTKKALSKARPYVVVSIFLLSALLTPPDLVTQLFLAFPLIALYEIAHLYARFKHC